ncbi:MAG: hypothetical protein H7A46_15385 [Verrucomicrobiales bacterium]|nr:hypothetical protein [Verrucomicrobiales bacterium]
MGLRFDLRAANWVAYLTDSKRPLPRLEQRWEEAEALRMFLRSFGENFLTSLEYSRVFRRQAHQALKALEELRHDWRHPEESRRLAEALSELRQILSERPWTALIVPGGKDRRLDHVLCSKSFLQGLVGIRPTDPGLILQLDSPPDSNFSLTDIFPAFRTALANSNQWPGILIWSNSGDSEFFPLPSRQHGVHDRSRWLFSHLATAYGVDLELLKQQYCHEFPEESRRQTEVVVIQLSDIHIGSKEAGLRIPRLQQLVRNLIAEIGENRRYVFRACLKNA